MFASFPRLIAGYHVFLRFSMPRHPPYTLSSLTTFIDQRLRSPGYTSGATVGRDCKTIQTTDNVSIRQKGARRPLPETGPAWRPFPDGKTKNSWAEVAEVYFAINLEPRIHFSKSIVPENFSGKIPAKRGSVNPSINLGTD